MVFALDHADCAAEVVDILQEALTLDETPIPTKVRESSRWEDVGVRGACLCPASKKLTLDETPRVSSPQMWRCVPWGM